MNQPKLHNVDSKVMKIYISIPISGHDLTTQTGKAMELAAKVQALGHEAVNPFDTPLAPTEWDERAKYAYYMGEDLKLLLGCDAILMADPMWTKSRGCRLEFEAARIYGLHDFARVEDIPKVRNEEP